MDVGMVGLAILAAAGWGAGSPLSKLGMERGGSPYQVALAVVTISGAAYWTALAVRGADILSLAPWVIGLFLVTGVFATAFARILTFEGVERLGSSINSAGINTRPVWASILAVIFLGETVTPQMGVGILVVVGGLMLVAFSKGGDLSGWETHQLLFPLTAAVTYGMGTVIRRFAFTSTNITPLQGAALNETAGFFAILVFFVIQNPSVEGFKGALAAPRRAYAFFAGSAFMNAFALLALFEALSRGPVVVVDPLSSPTSLFAILFTFIFLRRIERVTRRLLLGALLVITGVVLITGPDVSTIVASLAA